MARPSRHPDLQRCIDTAVPFMPRRSENRRRLRVATTLLSCRDAAALMNEMALPPETGASYVHLNVHNPRCPLRHEGRAGWTCKPGLEQLPVWGINWAAARLLCAHLGARLPTAQEWECFASNNDPARIYPWGDAEPSAELANFGELLGGPSAVDRYEPSELGLHDLAGNLSEWCEDLHTVDGHESRFERVIKGGAWSKDARYLRIASRRGKWQRLGTTTIGVRPVWDDTGV